MPATVALVRPIAALLSLSLFAAPEAANGFRNAEPGTPVRDRSMPTIDGRRAPLLGEGKISVLVFVRTEQEFSEIALRHLTELERELAGKPVRFVAIVSSSEPVAEVSRIAKELGFRMPVLVDEADALYGELGVAMHPSVGIVGRDRKLAAYQAFLKLNYLDAMRAQVQLALGEIDQAAFARVMDPGVQSVQAAPGGGRARARLKLARTLLAAGSFEPAVESARAAVALEPELAEAHEVLSEALAKAGRCDDAAREADIARKLAPTHPPTTLACAKH